MATEATAAFNHENKPPIVVQLVVELPDGMRLSVVRELLEMNDIVVRELKVANGNGTPRLRKTTVRLTPMETAVLKAFTYCDGNEEIAELLGISVSTVRTHAKHLFEKLNVSSRSFAVGRALRLGLLSVNDLSPPSGGLKSTR